MFCPNCGEKLESQDQKFCPSCGSTISLTPTPDAPQVTPEENQVSTPSTVSSISVNSTKVGGPGPYSKKVFYFACVSIVFVIVGFVLEYYSFIRFIMPIYLFPNLPGGPLLWIVALVFQAVGLIFAIVSRVNNKKAGDLEPKNPLRAVGSVFGIFGIVLNAIPLAIILPVMIIMTLGP